MKITKREKFLLKESLEFLINRYILSKRRMNGMERAENHLEIAKVIFRFVNCKKDGCKDWAKILTIHDDLTIITDNLDKYGYDINDDEQDVSDMADKVLDAIVNFVRDIR